MAEGATTVAALLKTSLRAAAASVRGAMPPLPLSPNCAPPETAGARPRHGRNKEMAAQLSSTVAARCIVFPTLFHHASMRRCSPRPWMQVPVIVRRQMRSIGEPMRCVDVSLCMNKDIALSVPSAASLRNPCMVSAKTMPHAGPNSSARF